MKLARLCGAGSVLPIILAGSAVAQSTQQQVPDAAGQSTVPPAEAPVPLAATPPGADQASVGDTPATEPVSPANPASADATAPDVVVTGIRSSLKRAAEIKRDAIQVVDSIVAQDIGKFPDPTTAAALQRVPGVQVSNNSNNELSGVRIRGLPDILTTVDEREVFTTTGRSFDLQDLPAEALARVDVYKSQTADLIEGGVAGAIDLKLNKPFNFRKPTLIVSARGNYGVQVGEANPQVGVLATDRWQTGIGEIGVLVSASLSDAYSLRTATSLTDERDSAAAPLATPGYFVPNILQNVTTKAHLRRREINGSLQWQASPDVQIYADGLFTQFKNRSSDSGFNIQPFTTSVGITNVVANGNCFNVRSTSTGQNPTVIAGANGSSLQPFTVKRLCAIDGATFTNAVANQTTGASLLDQRNLLIAGGVRYDTHSGGKLNLDVGYQTSASDAVSNRTAVGQRLPTLMLDTDDDGGARVTVPGDYLTRTDTLSLRNQLIQDYATARGDLLQVRLDGEQELGGFLPKVQVGLRYVDRSARFDDAQLSTALPFGNIGTATEASAKLVSQTGLPADFLALSDVEPRLNGGARFYAPNPDFLLDESQLDLLRAVYKLPSGRPADNPTRRFDASEQTYAVYGQLDYKVEFGGDLVLDGVVGLRATRTDRRLDTFSAPGTPVANSLSNTDLLPNATARLQVPGGFQARLSYSKAIRRPEFTSLNPAQTLIRDVNPAVLSTGTSGNPDLRPQKSDSYDATLEHYWKSGSVAVTGYYRTIVDRVITAGARQTIGGVDYVISSPRNVGRAKLKGVEVSGQDFFDFLPGALNGIGVLGAFTLADSKVEGGDPLAGNPLDGVSKYNFTTGLLYDKFGISGRLIYTYRSRYYVTDLSGQVQVRSFDESQPTLAVVPTLLEYVRPAGRLDFSLGYDITNRLRFDVGGTNVLRSKTRTYRGEQFFNGSYYDDETTYTAGVRYRF
jgi:iron complex outermembrane recepter protein